VNENSIGEGPETGPGELVERLRGVTHDLDGYIERRANEIAAPIIAEHQAANDAAVASLRAELRRSQDLFAEARQQITNLEDRLDDVRAAHGERRDSTVAARRKPVPLPPRLPVDTRPMPSVAAYDQLLSRRSPTAAPATGSA
jgi:hypothetical protein